MADKETETPVAAAPDPSEGPGKGKQFFDRAKTVAATGNYDYAIEMYVQGLNREPFNVEEHKALRDVAFNRKIKGGKSGGGLLGMGMKLPFKGKAPKDGMLNAAFQLAKDVGNINAMLAYIRNAVLLGHQDVVMWLGPMIREANRTQKKSSVDVYTELADIYAKYEEFAKACDAIQAASELKPNDIELSSLGQRYAAMETMRKGKYDQGGDFKHSIKDKDATKRLNEEENLNKSLEYLKKTMETSRADYLKNPIEPQLINKFAKSLIEMDEEQYENEAIQVLEKAFHETKIYRFKAGIGDVRIKQFKRNERLLSEAVRMDPQDKAMAGQLEQLRKERLKFELGEFRERAEHMPTDTLVRFELGMRLWHSGLFDEAIAAFQEAQTHPKHRVDAMHYLGRSFLQQDMKHEAVETLKHAIEGYDLAATGDRKSMELHYWYGRALEANANIPAAIDIYSKVVRWNFSYRDARQRLNDLRQQQGEAPAA